MAFDLQLDLSTLGALPLSEECLELLLEFGLVVHGHLRRDEADLGAQFPLREGRVVFRVAECLGAGDAGMVGEELAESTPYFTEALNEILAKGENLFG